MGSGGNVVAMIVNLKLDTNEYLGYHGTAHVQFKHPEAARRVLNTAYKWEARSDRMLWFQPSILEFDVVGLIEDRGGLNGTNYSVRAPRVNPRGSVGDYVFMHNRDGGFHTYPSQWDENFGKYPAPNPRRDSQGKGGGRDRPSSSGASSRWDHW